MQEQLDSHQKKIEQMTNRMNELEIVLSKNATDQKRILLWTQVGAILSVISIFLKIFFIKS
jgi:hypothetical protein